MLPLNDPTQLTTQLTRGEKDSDEIRVEIHSRSANGTWIRHAVARVEVGAEIATADSSGRCHRSRHGRCRRRTSTPRCAAPVCTTGRRSPR